MKGMRSNQHLRCCSRRISLCSSIMSSVTLLEATTPMTPTRSQSQATTAISQPQKNLKPKKTTTEIRQLAPTTNNKLSNNTRRIREHRKTAVEEVVVDIEGITVTDRIIEEDTRRSQLGIKEVVTEEVMVAVMVDKVLEVVDIHRWDSISSIMVAWVVVWGWEAWEECKEVTTHK